MLDYFRGVVASLVVARYQTVVHGTDNPTLAAAEAAVAAIRVVGKVADLGEDLGEATGRAARGIELVPVVHLDDLEVAADAEMLVEHPCEFADSHAVPRRYLKLADK